MARKAEETDFVLGFNPDEFVETLPNPRSSQPDPIIYVCEEDDDDDFVQIKLAPRGRSRAREQCQDALPATPKEEPVLAERAHSIAPKRIKFEAESEEALESDPQLLAENLCEDEDENHDMPVAGEMSPLELASEMLISPIPSSSLSSLSSVASPSEELLVLISPASGPSPAPRISKKGSRQKRIVAQEKRRASRTPDVEEKELSDPPERGRRNRVEKRPKRSASSKGEIKKRLDYQQPSTRRASWAYEDKEAHVSKSLSAQFRNEGLKDAIIIPKIRAAPEIVVHEEGLVDESLDMSNMTHLYQIARSKLQIRTKLVGRTNEMQEVSEFVRDAVGTGSSMYISGPSGVGKSLTVASVMDQLVKEKIVSSNSLVTVNLAADAIDSLLLHLVSILVPQKTVAMAGPLDKAKARSLLQMHRRAAVIVLEECDQKRHSKDVCALFEMVQKDACTFVLIGLGNSSDFLQSNQLTATREMAFAAYNAADLIGIVREKLSIEVEERLFEPSAMKLWSIKVSNASGDLRSATACLERAIDLAEADYYRRKLEGATGKVTMGIMKQMMDGWGSTKQTMSAVSGLTPQARLLLVGLARKRESSDDPTAWEFSDLDARQIFCTIRKQERPESGLVRTLLGSLLDTPFVTSAASGKYQINVDQVLLDQAIETDAQLHLFIK